MGLVVLVPTLGRPHKLKPLAEEFAKTTPDHRMLFIVDPGDSESHWEALQAGDVLVSERTGYSAKVNQGVKASDEEYILLAADDVKPHPNWFENAVKLMSDKIGYVSLNDLGNRGVMRGRFATFPLIARWYAELDDELYHEGYRHWFCDLEASERAKQRGAFAYAPDAVMEHMHPLWNKGEMDQTYEDWAYNQEGNAQDRALFHSRRHLWAPA